MTAPIRVDTELFTDDFDFHGFVRKVLGGTSGVGSLPTDLGNIDWFDRALALVHGTPYEARLTEAIADCLTDPDVRVRREALRFVESHSQSAGAERVVQVAEGDRRLFSGVADPDGGSIDLEWSLWHAVGARMMAGDEDAKQLGRDRALNSDDVEPFIAALAASDPQWVIAHAQEIVGRCPRAGSIILFNLERSGIDVGEIGEGIAPIAARGDRKFKADVKRYLDNPVAKDRILAATRKK